METAKKNIFVCTFCQVFSTAEKEIVVHIVDTHSSVLPIGTKAENFVSKLQALTSAPKKSNKKVGRPKKSDVKTSACLTPERKKPTDPVIGSDGYYACDVCSRSFKKARQLVQHVCIKLQDNNDSADTYSDFEEYSSLNNLSQVPWKLRKEKKKIASKNPTNDSVGETGRSYGWKQDTPYVHMFKNEKQREEFEQHLKSIDTSIVDNLFTVKKYSKERKNSISSLTAYTCLLCNFTHQSLSHIRMHCLTHTDAKPFSCPHCEYRTNAKGSLYTHIRSHTGSMFRCTHCPFQTKKRAHLLEHEETHSQIPQICNLCKNTYKTHKSLTMHVKRYHDSQNGKKYLRSLLSKQTVSHPATTNTPCDKNSKKFKSQTLIECHKLKDHADSISGEQCDTSSSSRNKTCNDQSAATISSEAGKQDSDITVKDPLEYIRLSDLYPQKVDEVSVKLYDAFSTPNVPVNSTVLNSQFSSLNENPVKVTSEVSVLLNDIFANSNNPDLDVLFPVSSSLVKSSSKNVEILNNSPGTQSSKRIECTAPVTRELSIVLDDIFADSNNPNFSHLVNPFPSPLKDLETLNSSPVKQVSDTIDDVTKRTREVSVVLYDIFAEPNNPVLNDCVLNSDLNPDISKNVGNLDESLMNSLSVDTSRDTETFSKRTGEVSVLLHDIFANSYNPISNDNTALNSDWINSFPYSSQDLEILNKFFLGANQNTTDNFRHKSPGKGQLFNSPGKNYRNQSSFSGKSINSDLLNDCLMQANFSESNVNEASSAKSHNSIKYTDSCSSFNPNSLDFDQNSATFTQNCDNLDHNSVSYEQNRPSTSFNQSSSSFAPNGISFDLPLIPMEFQNSNANSASTESETKSAETKLFEKCRQAPAYVCCVCSAIYICPSTLKVHLKEHVNSSGTLITTNEKDSSVANSTSEDREDLNVCQMLQDPSADEKEVEKLYNSSLMYYLPEVSVVLKEDNSIFDAFLADITNFPIPDDNDDADSMQCEDMFG